ncbi:hypothetical protein [Kocuria sp.]|uniref:hypothetical protein n=1 Tax=Kocuria sp. TaxID=1871328 RepID=UPI0026DB5455|nr:hypothetical protein [Kocuria sp.]MDO4919874.1 hypothetical protein [Kocuria sp.]
MAGDATGHQGAGRHATASPRTGLDPVDRVLAREADIARLPVTERAAAYEELHAELERILSEDPGKLPQGLFATLSPATAEAARGLTGAPRPGEAPRPRAGAPDTGEGRAR